MPPELPQIRPGRGFVSNYTAVPASHASRPDHHLTRGRKEADQMRTTRGSVTVEMTLVGIPLVFALISVFEMSRGMWTYHTLAFAANEGVRVAVVHGADCVNNPPTTNNNCTRTIGDIANVILKAGVGLEPEKTKVWFRAPADASPPTDCASPASCSCILKDGTVSDCVHLTSVWPPS